VEYLILDAVERPALPSAQEMAKEKARLEAVTELSKYSVSDAETALNAMRIRLQQCSLLTDLKLLAAMLQTAFDHVLRFSRSTRPATVQEQSLTDSAGRSHSFSSPADDEVHKLEALKRTALLVINSLLANAELLQVEMVQHHTPEVLLHVAKIASLMRKLMEGQSLPSEWRALVAPPATISVQSERDLQTLYDLVGDAVTLSSRISALAKVAESYCVTINQSISRFRSCR